MGDKKLFHPNIHIMLSCHLKESYNINLCVGPISLQSDNKGIQRFLISSCNFNFKFWKSIRFIWNIFPTTNRQTKLFTCLCKFILDSQTNLKTGYWLSVEQHQYKLRIINSLLCYAQSHFQTHITKITKIIN